MSILHATRPRCPLSPRVCTRCLARLLPLTSRHRSKAAASSRRAARSSGLRGSLSDELYGSIAADHEDGPQLVPLDADSSEGLGGTSADAFGELAVVLIGFTEEEFTAFRSMMIAMEGDMVKLICCSNAMLDGTLQSAVESPAVRHEQLPPETRRAVLLSGMYTGEVMEVISAYRDEGLPATLWGAAVPNNYGKVLRDLVAEMYGDFDYMRAKQAAARAESS